MKSPILLLAVFGLVALAGCGKSPEAQSVANNADMLQEALDAQADNLEAMADNSANAAAAAMIENQADALKQASDNVGEAADATIDNMR